MCVPFFNLNDVDQIRTIFDNLVSNNRMYILGWLIDFRGVKELIVTSKFVVMQVHLHFCHLLETKEKLYFCRPFGESIIFSFLSRLSNC